MSSSADDRFDDFIWYLSAEKRLSPNTVEAYRHDLRAWAEILPGLFRDLSCPSEENLIRVLGVSRERGWAKATEARRRAALRHFARYRALTDGDWSRLLGVIPAAAGEAKFPKALALAELKAFLDFEPADHDPLERHRDKALFELLYASGLRVSEILSLRWADVHFDDGWVRVIGKGDAERLVPSSQRALACLRSYQNRVRDRWHGEANSVSRETVFLSRRLKPLTRMGVWKIVHRRGIEVGLDSLHPHILRHSFATHLIQGGADVRVVQMLLGHKSLTATERYLKISDRELFKLFTEFHPLG